MDRFSQAGLFSVTKFSIVKVLLAVWAALAFSGNGLAQSPFDELFRPFQYVRALLPGLPGPEDGLNELVILDPGTHPEGLPAVKLRYESSNGGRPLKVEIAPTVHVHRYYFCGAKEYQAPNIAGGPTVIVANHPFSGKRVYIDAMLPPGTPLITYRKESITYSYPERRVICAFSPLCPDKALISYVGAFDFHLRHASNQKGLPAHSYGHDEEIRSLTVSTLLAQEDKVVLQVGQDCNRCRFDYENPYYNSGSLLSHSQANAVLVRRKYCRLAKPTIEVDQIKLDQIALVVYETGELACSGRISNIGGLSNEVTIAVRAYGNTNSRESPNGNAGPLLLESRQTLQVFRGQPQLIHLAPRFNNMLRIHFNEIKQMQVSVAYKTGVTPTSVPATNSGGYCHTRRGKTAPCQTQAGCQGKNTPVQALGEFPRLQRLFRQVRDNGP